MLMPNNETCCTQNSEQYYFYEEALGVSSSIHSASGEGISLGIVFFLLLAWLFVFASVVNGVRSTAKVVYFTVIVPYGVMICLIIVGACQLGSHKAREAAKAFFKFDVKLLLSKCIETQ